MSKRAPQAFRPRLDEAEQRLLTTVMAGMGAIAQRPAFQLRMAVNREMHLRAPLARPAFNRPHHPLAPRPLPGPRPGWNPAPGPCGPVGPIGSTANFINWGVITIVNTTSRPVTFAVAASTYNGGRFENFTLPSGGRQAYYASFGGPFGGAPTFSVTFDVVRRFNIIQVPEINVVNQSPNWRPNVGTEGRPYAIVERVSGYDLVSMS